MSVADPVPLDKAGALQSVELDGGTYVDHIAYNPRGQRILAALGNGVMTRYSYNEKTFRLQRLRSEEYEKVGDDFELPTEGKNIRTYATATTPLETC